MYFKLKNNSSTSQHKSDILIKKSSLNYSESKNKFFLYLFLRKNVYYPSVLEGQAFKMLITKDDVKMSRIILLLNYIHMLVKCMSLYPNTLYI